MVLSDTFDGGFGPNWISAHPDAEWSPDGQILLRADGGTGAMMTTENLGSRTKGYLTLRLKFSALPVSFEEGEGFVVEYEAGKGWVEAKRFASGTDLVNGVPLRAIVELREAGTGTWPDLFGGEAFMVRIRAIGSMSADYVYIDNVVLEGKEPSPSLRR